MLSSACYMCNSGDACCAIEHLIVLLFCNIECRKSIQQSIDSVNDRSKMCTSELKCSQYTRCLHSYNFFFTNFPFHGLKSYTSHPIKYSYFLICWMKIVSTHKINMSYFSVFLLLFFLCIRSIYFSQLNVDRKLYATNRNLQANGMFLILFRRFGSKRSTKLKIGRA